MNFLKSLRFLIQNKELCHVLSISFYNILSCRKGASMKKRYVGKERIVLRGKRKQFKINHTNAVYSKTKCTHIQYLRAEHILFSIY